MLKSLLSTLFFFVFAFGYSQITPNDIVDDLNIKTFELINQNIDKAELYSDKTLTALNQNRDQINLISQSDVYSARGTIFQVKMNYWKALRNFQKCLDLRIKYAKNRSKLFNIYLNIANCHYEMGHRTKTLNHYKKCLKYADTKTEPMSLLSVYNGIAVTYEQMNRTDSAKYYYQKSANAIHHLKDKNIQEVADYYSNIAQFHETAENLSLAQSNLIKAIGIEQKLGNNSGLAWSYHHMGIINHKKGNLAKAKSYFHKAEKLAKGQNDLEIQRDIFNSRMLLYSEEGKLDSVNFYFDKANQLNTIINKKTTDKRIAVVETRYKTKQQQARLNSAQERESLLLYSGSSIVFILIFLSFFLIRNYYQKQRIALLNVDLKDREINDLLGKQENAAFAAMLEGQDTERLRIARELHDRLGSTLATVKLSLQNGSGIDVNEQQMQLVNNAIGEVREIAHDLSGGNIERYGLMAALQELKQTIERTGTIQLELYLEANEVPSNLQVPVYRIVQELISNTLKHAAASQISLQIMQSNDELQLIYEDNGSGFNPDTTISGMGLNNIRHRIEKWDGMVEIDSQLNRGTIVIITIPVTHLP